MKASDVRQRAFAMPLTSPAYPIGPYRFVNREFLVITYRTDPKKLREGSEPEWANFNIRRNKAKQFMERVSN